MNCGMDSTRAIWNGAPSQGMSGNIITFVTAPSERYFIRGTVRLQILDSPLSSRSHFHILRFDAINLNIKMGWTMDSRFINKQYPPIRFSQNISPTLVYLTRWAKTGHSRELYPRYMWLEKTAEPKWKLWRGFNLRNQATQVELAWNRIAIPLSSCYHHQLISHGCAAASCFFNMHTFWSR